MVSAVRHGASMRRVAGEFGVSLRTVQRWVSRAHAKRLDRVEWASRPSGCRTPVNRVPAEIEDLVLEVRRELKAESDLGEFGAAAIHRALAKRGIRPVPSVRTLGRVLERRGALDGQRRQRFPSPPRGWYLPRVAAFQADLDAFDLIEDLCLEGGPRVDVLTALSLHGSLAHAWPQQAPFTARDTATCLVERWRRFGLPGFAQFDNDTRFQGAHHHPDSVGRVIRLCLQLGVVPVFAPPRERGFQSFLESFNGRWEQKVWSRFHHPSLSHLQDWSRRHLAAHRRHHAPRIEHAPSRRPFPKGWTFDMQKKPQGRIIYLRRADEGGRANVLGHPFLVDSTWGHRLLRCEVDLDRKRIRFHGLRRRAPKEQPLLKEVYYELPNKPFQP